MDHCIQSVYTTILERKNSEAEKSYTRYLFQQGTDKVLKKIGEEAAEIIIAAKNGENTDTIGEICDLTYHMLVLMAQQGITPDDVAEELSRRHTTSGNLKTFNQVDKNT